MPQIRKRWLLLLLIPVAVAAIPVLVFGMFMGTELLSMVAGPVNIFNTPRHAPGATEIAGYYRLSKTKSREPEGVVLPEHAGFTLGTDHSLEMHEVPAGFEGALNCDYNGAGKWNLSSVGGDIQLVLMIRTSTPAKSGERPSCDVANYAVMAYVLGRWRPHRIWFGIGDTSDQGLTYELQNP